MTAQEAYNYGFCKAAADAGVNPVELVKLAAESKSDNWWDSATKAIGNAGRSVADAYKNLSPAAKSSLLTGLASGVGTYALSDGQTSDRLGKALIGAGLGGGAMYAAEKTGLTTDVMDVLIKHLANARLRRTHPELQDFRERMGMA